MWSTRAFFELHVRLARARCMIRSSVASFLHSSTERAIQKRFWEKDHDVCSPHRHQDPRRAIRALLLRQRYGAHLPAAPVPVQRAPLNEPLPLCAGGYENILTEVRGKVAIITLNRPKVRTQHLGSVCEDRWCEE